MESLPRPAGQLGRRGIMLSTQQTCKKCRLYPLPWSCPSKGQERGFTDAFAKLIWDEVGIPWAHTWGRCLEPPTWLVHIITQDPATLELISDYKKQSYKKFFSLKTTFWPRSKDTPVAMNTHGTQIAVSNIILQQKEQRHLGKMADSRPGAGNIQDNLECLLV